MPKKILCTLPNASTNINGIEFEETTEGVISKEFVSDKVAERFATIRGYSLVDEAASKAEGKRPADSPTKAAAGRGSKGTSRKKAGQEDAQNEVPQTDAPTTEADAGNEADEAQTDAN